MRDSPRISVVITTRNEEAVLPTLLESLASQTYPHLEAIVVDNDSTDRTKVVARRYTPLVFNYGPERSAQRNFGARQATGDYLLFLDSDMELAATVVAECLDAMQMSGDTGASESGIGGVIIPEISYGVGHWARVKAFERSFYSNDDAIESARFFDRQVFKIVGGYDESLTGPEDWDLSERVRGRYRIARITAVIRHNERRPTLLRSARKSYYYAQNVNILLSKHHMSAISGRTVYFLRPAFYRQWRRLLSHPIMSLSLLILLTVQLVAGGVSFLQHAEDK
jgi:glycosyltransferase involved in cell wall biosynthesis